MTLVVILLLALISHTLAWQNMPISMDSIEEGYQMIVNHQDPWWGFEASNEDLGSSYQYYYPYYSHKKVQSSFNTRKKPNYNIPTPTLNRPKPTYNRPNPTYNRPKPSYNRHKPAYNRPVRGHYPKPPPIQPTPPTQSESSTREWPSWIPPVRFFKLPLDEPPAAID
ncbi:uncharacterized protein LOC129225923 [Uloborus diversus]|uniref:uncharacterized protein LOC129225923 n=1 Tax=Uloborus diversus TaxID=327109 RepID=UPI002409509D|nr:uncharacterized protein LOC129225923 [Uloborus diversus]